MKQYVISIVMWFSAMSVIEAARILVAIPAPSLSHQIVYRPLSQELARRGHQVVTITTDPVFPKGATPQNLTEIDIHDISYDYFLHRSSFTKISRGKRENFLNAIEGPLNVHVSLNDLQFGSKEVKDLLRKEHFDLVITQAISRPYLALGHVFKAPVVLANTFGAIYDNLDVFGAPSHPLLYPNLYRARINKLSFWEKLIELYNYFKMYALFKSHEDKENAMLRKHFGENLPSLTELSNNVDFLLLNQHPVFEGNPPLPKSIAYMWGVHKNPGAELTQDLKSYLDNSARGVIYMSFGTNTHAKHLSLAMVQKFVNVFCRLPYNIVWKWDFDELPGRCGNIKIGKWFPQPQLLKHPNIKLFITQGGLQSTDEAITAEVPMVGVPMLADQWYNVENYERLGIGKLLEAGMFSEDDLRSTIATVIEDESYRRNIQRCNQLMRDQQTSGLQRAVFWIEHLLRHKGGRHLRAPAANVSWADYYEVNLIILVAFCLITLVAVVILALRYVYCCVMGKFWKVLDRKNK